LRIFELVQKINSINILINHNYSLGFEPFWFNSDEYCQFQSVASNIPAHQFYYKKDDKEILTIFFEDGETWLSPLRAPFGGFEFSRTIDSQILYEFLQEVISCIKSKGGKKIVFSLAPECYELEKADLVDEVLLHSGFQISVTELNYHLSVKENSFETNLHESERRRLKKCLDAGFTFEISNSPDVDFVHQFIANCRLRKGYPLSMNASDFKKMFEAFAERYILFTVKDNAKIIAVAVGVKVHSSVLYNFLPADDKNYLSFSPMVLLNKGIFDYCKLNGFEIFDLGIATSGGIQNPGLIKFKEHLGGELSHKYSYELNI